MPQDDGYEDDALNAMGDGRTSEESGSEHYGMLHSPTLEGAHVLARLEHAGAGNIDRHVDNEKDLFEKANQTAANQGNHFSDDHAAEHYHHDFRSVSEKGSPSNARRTKDNGLLRSRESRYNCGNDNIYSTDVIISEKRVVVDMMATEVCHEEEEGCLRHDDVQCDDGLVHVREDDYDRCYADNSEIKTRDDNDSDDVVGDGVHEFEE